MLHLKCASLKLPKMAIKDISNTAMVQPEHWVFCTMPHPPPHIWARPCDQSLQLLYLSTTITTSFITKTEIESNVFTPIVSVCRQGLHVGLGLKGHSAPPDQCVPQPHPGQQLWAPAVACAPSATVVSVGLNSSGC